MNIEEKFNIIAKEYDVNRKNFIPCFDDFYGNATKMITSNIDVPKLVLDLGAGTGLLTEILNCGKNVGNLTGNVLLKKKLRCCIDVLFQMSSYCILIISFQ